MSATNSTPNYHFPIFIGSDVPSWLVDWNNAMSALDEAIAAALLAGQTAEADVNLLEDTVTSIQTAVTALTSTVDATVEDVVELKGQMTAFTAIVNQLTADVQNLTARVEAAEGKVGQTYDGIIGVGETTVTIATPTLTNDSLIDVYFSEDKLVPVSTVGNPTAKTVTVTVAERETNLNVKVMIRN